MANTERSVELWASWHLLHLGGDDYKLLKYSGKAWLNYQHITAEDDQAALNKSKNLIQAAERKKDVNRKELTG